MPKAPLLSIITVNFNDKLGLQRTFDSVFNQTFQDFEYIVIDGGSTDGSKELIEKNSEKINHWVSEPDSGIYNAMNKGIAAAKGDYLLFLNSGDHFHAKNSLEIAAKYLGEEDIIYFDLEVISPETTFIKKYPKKLDLLYFYEDSLPHPSTFIKKSAFERVGFYDENLKIVSDWKWFLLAICKFSCTYQNISETISSFYLDGISSHSESITKLKLERENVISENFSEFENYLQKIAELKDQNKHLEKFQIKYEHLKKYKLVQLMAKFGFIKIY